MNEFAQRSLSPTPLHARTAELCATNQWASCGGFTVPSVYSSDREESEALTFRVAICDLSARQSLKVDGPDAALFLGFATTSDVALLDAGQTTRALWCDDEGYVRGEGQIVRYGKTHFELSGNIRDFAWFADGARGFDVKVTNITGQRAGIGVRGPLARHLMEASGFVSSQNSGADAAASAVAWRQTQIALLKDQAGDGFELWCDADDGVVVWDRLLRVGAAFGVAPVGAAVLEVTRIELALPMPGVDWHPAQLARTEQDLRLPSDLGLRAASPRRFNGSLGPHRSSGSGAGKLVLLSSPEVLMTGPVLQKGANAGLITSAAWSASRERSNAIAWIRSELAQVNAEFQAPGVKHPVTASLVRDCYL